MATGNNPIPKINGHPLTEFGAECVDFTVSGTPIDNSYFQGINRSTWHQLKTIYGMRTITLKLVFIGSVTQNVMDNKSLFDAQCFGKSVLDLGDSTRSYSVMCDKLGAAQIVSKAYAGGLSPVLNLAMLEADYTFKGICQDPSPLGGTITPELNTIICGGTMPYIDCKLETTVGAASDAYHFGGAVWSGVAAGDVLVFDGIDGKITKNGQPYAGSVSWSEFPYLVPGTNTIEITDTTMVTYYPAFI
nr:MAG TPA: tail protein [Caudoviricetes sp.]